MEEKRVHVSKVEVIVLAILIVILTLATAAVHSQYAIDSADASFYGISVNNTSADTNTNTTNIEQEVDQFFWGLPLFHH